MQRPRIEILAGCLVLLMTCRVAVTDESDQHEHGQKHGGVRFDPVVQKIEGWTVHVDPALLDGDQQEEGARALSMLANHLQRIVLLMSDERLRAISTATTSIRSCGQS